MNNEEIEIKLLIDAVRIKYGYDFSEYSPASFYRRVKRSLTKIKMEKISDMIPELIYNRDFFLNFLFDITVNVTEMFRDPLFFLSLRKMIIPYLKSYPFIKIWSAGSSTGEEAYSLAILLQEEGMGEKNQIYATDFNDEVLKIAQKGIYPIRDMKKITQNYQKSGGKESFSNYYTSGNNSVILNRSLRENIVFANHNLVTDGVFGEMNLILCRNVLIYFNNNLQNHVLKLFDNSLSANGFLCLGKKETIDFSSIKDCFTIIDKKRKIYQKKIAPYDEENR